MKVWIANCEQKEEIGVPDVHSCSLNCRRDGASSLLFVDTLANIPPWLARVLTMNKARRIASNIAKSHGVVAPLGANDVLGGATPRRTLNEEIDTYRFCSGGADRRSFCLGGRSNDSARNPCLCQ